MDLSALLDPCPVTVDAGRDVVPVASRAALVELLAGWMAGAPLTVRRDRRVCRIDVSPRRPLARVVTDDPGTLCLGRGARPALEVVAGHAALVARAAWGTRRQAAEAAWGWLEGGVPVAQPLHAPGDWWPGIEDGDVAVMTLDAAQLVRDADGLRRALGAAPAGAVVRVRGTAAACAWRPLGPGPRRWLVWAEVRPERLAATGAAMRPGGRIVAPGLGSLRVPECCWLDGAAAAHAAWSVAGGTGGCGWVDMSDA